MKMTEDLESVMGGIRMGVNVDIKRTDGRTTSTYLSINLYIITLYYRTDSIIII